MYSMMVLPKILRQDYFFKSIMVDAPLEFENMVDGPTEFHNMVNAP